MSSFDSSQLAHPLDLNLGQTTDTLSSSTVHTCECQPHASDHSASIYLTLDADQVVVAVNPNGAACLGYTPDTIVGQSVFNLFSSADQPKLKSFVQHSLDATEIRQDVLHLIGRGDRLLAVRATLQAWYGQGTQRLLACHGLPPQSPLLQLKTWQKAISAIFPVSIFVADANGQCIDTSGHYREMTGMTITEVRGNGWEAAIHPDDRQRVCAEWLQAVQTEGAFHTEHRLNPDRAAVVWVLAQAIAERDSDGNVVGYVGTLTDITERKLAEETLRQQADREKLLRAIGQHVRQSLDLKQTLYTTVTEIQQILEADRVLIYRLHANGSGSVMMEAVAPGCKAIRGQLLPEAILPPNYYQLYLEGRVRTVSDVEQDSMSDCLVELLKQLEVKSKIVVPIRQNDRLWGLLIAHQCQSSRHWQPAEIDLLEEIASQVEFAIQQSELYQQVQRLNADLERQINLRTAQLRLAFDFEATLKRITDKVRDSLEEDQILQAAVQELAQVIGVNCCNAALYDLEQGTSTIRYEHTISVSSSHGRVAQLAAYGEIYDQLFRGQSFQFCSLVPHPTRGHVAMLSSPIFDDQGVIGDLWLINHKYYAFNEQDIRLVEQVANQCAIAIRQARLYQAAQAQVQELEKLHRLKDDFLSTVSHELRTPMSSIKMATQMLELILFRNQESKELATLPSSSVAALTVPHSLSVTTATLQKASRYFQILRTECQREISLINDLLDLSRLDAGTEPLVLTAVSVPQWIDRLVEPFMERMHQQQQHLQIELPSDLPLLTTDRADLDRITTELLNNACKYTPANETITVSARIQGDRFQLQFSNSGVEVPPAEQSRIFDKFYRIPNRDPWQHGGTGLGLALVKKLAEHLGGRIQVCSTTQQTSFILELPFVPTS
ncbi:GAF domain-containing protein [Oculatella sp. LEGE 06141]|uniref:GAF domain-containing protein n=1 Tax=Oculatella sp. LEGE 06141 TaxID=1828648 RepID=UPI00187F428A|nr:GAF domain-containing protein [Oculatella sp. LEGE 06141]